MPFKVGPDGKQLRGLACVPPEERKKIASKGQKAARAKGGCYSFDHETAVRAGHKGGAAPKRHLKTIEDITERTEVAIASAKHDANEMRALIGDIAQEVAEVERMAAAAEGRPATRAEAAEAEELLVKWTKGVLPAPVVTALGRFGGAQDEAARQARVNEKLRQQLAEVQRRVAIEGTPPSPAAETQAISRDIAKLEMALETPPAAPSQPISVFRRLMGGLKNVD